MNVRDQATIERDTLLLKLYPDTPTYMLAEKFGMTETAIRARAKYHKVAKKSLCARKPKALAVKKPPKPAPQEDPQIPDGAILSATSHGVQIVRLLDGWRVITHKIR